MKESYFSLNEDYKELDNNVWGFEDHTAAIKTTKLCHSTRKADRQNRNEWHDGVPVGGPDLVHEPQVVDQLWLQVNNFDIGIFIYLNHVLYCEICFNTNIFNA